MDIDKSEIAVSFRLAKDKRNQVEVLADLNQCSPYNIAKALDEIGELRKFDLTPDMFSSRFVPVAADKKPEGRAPKRPRVVMVEIRAMELYEDGLDDLAMSEALGVGVCRARRWWINLPSSINHSEICAAVRCWRRSTQRLWTSI